MEHLSEEKALEILRKHSKDEQDYDNVLRHSRAVQELALETAQDIEGVDLDFLRTASLLHDIGRFSCNPGSKDSIRHGVEGARILEGEGLPAHARVAKVHIGCGITKEEVHDKGLPLPEEDMVPETKEELIITYADNLINHDRRMDEAWVEERYARELGEMYRDMVRGFNNKIHSLKKNLNSLS